jgi:hypothetical protein
MAPGRRQSRGQQRLYIALDVPKTWAQDDASECRQPIVGVCAFILPIGELAGVETNDDESEKGSVVRLIEEAPPNVVDCEVHALAFLERSGVVTEAAALKVGTRGLGKKIDRPQKRLLDWWYLLLPASDLLLAPALTHTPVVVHLTDPLLPHKTTTTGAASRGGREACDCHRSARRPLAPHDGTPRAGEHPKLPAVRGLGPHEAPRQLLPLVQGHTGRARRQPRDAAAAVWVLRRLARRQALADAPPQPRDTRGVPVVGVGTTS